MMMISFAAPPATTSRTRSRTALWTRLVDRLAPAEQHDPSLRAGAERRAAPMLMSISLGGAAYLR